MDIVYARTINEYKDKIENQERIIKKLEEELQRTTNAMFGYFFSFLALAIFIAVSAYYII